MDQIRSFLIKKISEWITLNDVLFNNIYALQSPFQSLTRIMRSNVFVISAVDTVHERVHQFFNFVRSLGLLDPSKEVSMCFAIWTLPLQKVMSWWDCVHFFIHSGETIIFSWIIPQMVRLLQGHCCFSKDIELEGDCIWKVEEKFIKGLKETPLTFSSSCLNRLIFRCFFCCWTRY